MGAGTLRAKNKKRRGVWGGSRRFEWSRELCASPLSPRPTKERERERADSASGGATMWKKRGTFVVLSVTGGLGSASSSEKRCSSSPLTSPFLASAQHLRIVDKPSIAPPTTYLDATFRRCLESARVEYRQANLALPGTPSPSMLLNRPRSADGSSCLAAADKVAAAFEPPTGCDRWDHVFDLTGDVGWDRPEMVRYACTAPGSDV